MVPPLRPIPIDLCLFHRLTGLPCLTCGLTRSVCLLLHGEWLQGLRMHPAGGFALALLILAAGIMGAEAASGRSLSSRLTRCVTPGLLALGGVASLIHWIARIALG